MKLDKHLAQGKIIYFHADKQQLTIAENSHYRWLCLDDVVQSMMLKRQPWQLTLPHQLAMVLPLQFFTPSNILEIGLGGGALVRYIKKWLPDCKFTSLELNSVVVEQFNHFFNPEHLSTNIVNATAENWLALQPNLAFDWVVIDIFLSVEDSVISSHLLDTLVNKAKEQSLITLNLPNEQEQEIETLLKQLKRLPNVQVVYFYVPLYKNIVLHILPATLKLLTNHDLSPLMPYQKVRWQSLWQQGICL